MEWLTNSSFLAPAPADSALSLFLRGASAPQNAPAASSQREDQKSERTEIPEKENELRKAKQLVVPEWFTNFFNTGVLSVVGLNSVTLFSAGLNLALPKGLGAGKLFYQVGLVAALGHFVFVPFVGRSVRALVGLAAARAGGKEGVKEEGNADAVELVREWVGYHKVRMCSVDVLAWACFVWGGVHAITAKA